MDGMEIKVTATVILVAIAMMIRFDRGNDDGQNDDDQNFMGEDVAGPCVGDDPALSLAVWSEKLGLEGVRNRFFFGIVVLEAKTRGRCCESYFGTGQEHYRGRPRCESYRP